MSIKETYDNVTTLVGQLAENHQKNRDGNKAAGGRARKSDSELKKILTVYRKESIEESKA